VLINLLDDEFGFHEVGVVEPLTIDPLQRVVRQCCRKCCLLLLVSRARDADRVDVRRDQEIRPFELPGFEVVAVLLDVELRCLAVVSIYIAGSLLLVGGGVQEVMRQIEFGVKLYLLLHVAVANSN
jgi:hypothetical protein